MFGSCVLDCGRCLPVGDFGIAAGLESWSWFAKTHAGPAGVW